MGIHPNETADADESAWRRILALAADPKVVALGETGLDLHWKRVPLGVQVAWLERHAEAALEADLPLVLHLREAWPAAREALAPYAARGLRAVLHCFGGTERDLEPFLGWGWPISFAGNLTYPGSGALRRAAARVPLDQLLVETDAPWLAPVPCRGRVNEPAFVVHTARRLAEILGRTYEEVAEATSRNALRFFRIEP
ncbi:MAG: TatD family hydrolase [Acidobacteriota bacterium]|nr:TatD family hydrolase [Acidobacteriota bacterium]